MVRLDLDDLHAATRDPVLDTVTFLNEVMARYPDAISFAPGAPNPRFLGALDETRYIERYLDHLSTGELSRDRARRLLFEYGPSRGLINHLVADALRIDHGLSVPPDAIVITVGAQEAMLLVLRALFGRQGDALAVVSPCYVGLTGAARLLEVELTCVAEGQDGIDLRKLDETCSTIRRAGRRVRALYVAPDFANPAGTVISLDGRKALLDLADRHDLLLVEDTAYAFTAMPDAELPTLKALDTAGRVICVGTFAKVCLPGARVGFVVADQQVSAPAGATCLLADRLAALKTMTTVNTSPICQAIIGGMLLEHGGSLASLGEQRAALYRGNLRLLLDLLDDHDLPPAVSWDHPAGGFFVRMRVPVPADAALLEKSAAGYGVLWTPMSQFYPGGGGTHELRLSCSYLEPTQIETGVKRLAAFLHDLTPTAWTL